MADPKIEKVLHGADNDIMLLKRDFKFEFASVFDTQVAARFAGRPLLGLGLELVADAVSRLQEGVSRGARVDLLAQLADEDVDRAVAV